MAKNRGGHNMKVVDLFCGAGGFSEGFRQAGFEIVAGVDNWVVALQSFNKNFPDAKIIYKDVTYLNPKHLPHFDVLIGSPPCKEWSMGKQGKRNFDKKCINAFMKIVWACLPKFWVWECAPETKALSDNAEILNAFNFGVPQVRCRAFHANFKLPEGTRKGKTLDEVFAWSEPKVLYNHFALNTEAHAPIYLSNRPARTVVTWPIRIYKDGIFTVEMMKKVQALPDNFYLGGKDRDKFTQIGNAVCPPVAKSIAEAILEAAR